MKPDDAVKAMPRPNAILRILLLTCLAAAGRGQYLEDSVNCGGRGVWSLAYNSLANVVYGASEDGPFFAISADSNKLVSVTWFDYPVRVAYDSIDNKVYCIVRTANHDTIMVMDGTTHQRIGKIPLEWGAHAVWNPDNDRLYVTMDEMNKVAVIDCKSDTIITEVPVGSGAVRAVLNRVHQKLYVQNWDSYDISIVDLATNQVIKTIATGDVPLSGTFCDAVDKFYCSCMLGVVVVDGASDVVLTSVAMPESPRAMVACEGHALVVAAAGDSLLVVDAQQDSVVSRLHAGVQPQAFAWSARSDQVYCANSPGEVVVLPGDCRRIALTLDVAYYPVAFALASENGRLYVGHQGSSYVYVVRDTASGVMEPTAAHVRGRGAVLAQPNPFRGSVAIRLNRTARGRNVARVYAQDGRLVRESRVPEGEARWVWDGRENCGTEVPAGVYFIEATGIARALVVKLE